MKKRQLIWLGGALVALLLIAYLTGAFDSDISTVDVPEVNISRDDVERIRVDGPEEVIELRKDGGSWLLTQPVEAPADSVAVADALEQLEDLELETMVSSSPDRYERYGVDSAATELTVGWDGEERTFIIGDQGPGFGSNYVRLNGDDAVYLTEERLDPPSEADEWRDKEIVDLAPSQIERVEFAGLGRSYAIEREETDWTLIEDGTSAAADSASTARYLERFHPLEADLFPESMPAESDSTVTIRIHMREGAERVFTLSPVDDDYALTVDEGETVYGLRGYRLIQIAPEINYFEEQEEQ